MRKLNADRVHSPVVFTRQVTVASETATTFPLLDLKTSVLRVLAGRSPPLRRTLKRNSLSSGSTNSQIGSVGIALVTLALRDPTARKLAGTIDSWHQHR